MKSLLKEIGLCKICEPHLPLGARPVVSGSSNSRVLIIGQAPGLKVHRTGIPWDDPSGRQLRKWLNVSDELFYDKELFALIPMGFCYPGKGKSGDLPPRKECAETWHKRLLDKITDARLTILIGNYAQKYYLGKDSGKSLTENVQNYNNFLPRYFPLPHPSPRNRFWLSKNPWFELEVLPELKKIIQETLEN